MLAYSKVDYDIPNLNDLGFEEFEVNENSVFKFKGGETAGKSRVDDYFFRTKNVTTYFYVYFRHETLLDYTFVQKYYENEKRSGPDGKKRDTGYL